MTFHLKSFAVYKSRFRSSQFKIQNFQTISDWKTTKIEVIDLNENYNFVVDDFFRLKLFVVVILCFKFLQFEI
jgi:hypothetical protein